MNEPEYHPYFCEENAVRLAKSLGGWVVFISNAGKHAALWGQRASDGPDLPIFWDYHVICVDEKRRIWDLDAVAGAPLDGEAWLSAAFPFGAQIRAEYLPSFRPVSVASLPSRFSSDRRHMRNQAGWIKPPPPWEPIFDERLGHTLPKLIDVNYAPHEWLSLDEFSAWLNS